MFYLDHAAATPLSKRSLVAMQPYFSDDFFNPSAPYLPAQDIRDAYDSAKDTIAHAVGGKGTDLIITASATESINLAFTVLKSADFCCSGACRKGAGSAPTSSPTAATATCEDRLARKRTPESKESETLTLISATEHPSVVAAAENHTTIRVNKHGLLDLADLAEKITPAIQLVSVSLASSELGTIQPLSKISEIIKTERLRRQQSADPTPLYFHSDASAAMNLLDVKVSRLGVDLLTFSSAKIYGPKGVAALWVRPGTPIKPLVLGGGQESGLRSGTENVPGVIGFAAAISDIITSQHSEQKRLAALKSTLRTLLSANPSILFLGDPRCQLASHLPISIPGLDAERLIYKLEEKQVYLSTGSACAASRHEISPTLNAIGLSPEEIAGSLRITLGKLNNEQSIKQAARLILQAISEEQSRVKG